MANSKISALTSATTPLAGTETLPIVQGGAPTKQVSVANLTAGRSVSALQYQAAINSSTVWTPDTSATNIQINNSAAAANSTALFQAQVVDDASTTGGVKFGAVAVASGTSGGYSADFVIANRKVGTYYENFRVKYNGDINFTVGNLVQGTAAKGINFTANTPASGSTTQLLNAYDSGTFTPTFTNLTVVGTLTVTGNYTRIGRMVYVNIRIQSTGSTTSVTGTTYANTGFPFVSANIYTAALTINTGTNAGFSTQSILGLSGGNTIIYTAGWTALADVTITGFYFV